MEGTINEQYDETGHIRSLVKTAARFATGHVKQFRTRIRYQHHHCKECTARRDKTADSRAIAQRQITRLFRLSNTASPPRCVRERSPSRLALRDPRRAFTSQLKPLSCGPPLGPLPHYDARIRINSSAKPSPVEIRRINEVKEKPRKNLPPEGEGPAEVKLGDKQDEIRLHVWVVREDQRAGTQSGREGENEVSRSARCVCIREALPLPPFFSFRVPAIVPCTRHLSRGFRFR